MMRCAGRRGSRNCRPPPHSAASRPRQDVADLAAFLASDEAEYITGQAINLVGGLIMH